MTHLKDNQIQAFLDDNLPAPYRDEVAGHLSICASCRDQAEQLAGIHSLLSSLDTGPATPVNIARARFDARINASNKEIVPMNKKLRPVLAPVLLVALLLILLSVPSVRAAAVDFLGLFRVQQIEVVRFNPANLPDNMEGRMMDYDQLLADQFTFSGGGEPVSAASAEEASSMAGFDVRLPAGMQSPQLTYQPAGEASIAVDLALWQGLLDDLGRNDLELPADLDGETITIRIANSVTAVSGECAAPREPSGDFRPPQQMDCQVLVQMPSPSIEAPAGLPVAELGQVFLQFFGMSPEEAARFSAQVDWTTTLVIPVPYSAQYRDVQIGSADGVLFEDTFDSGSANLSLVWVDGDMLYALMASGDTGPSEMVELAESLR